MSLCRRDLLGLRGPNQCKLSICADEHARHSESGFRTVRLAPRHGFELWLTPHGHSATLEHENTFKSERRINELKGVFRTTGSASQNKLLSFCLIVTSVPRLPLLGPGVSETVSLRLILDAACSDLREARVPTPVMRPVVSARQLLQNGRAPARSSRPPLIACKRQAIRRNRWALFD